MSTEPRPYLQKLIRMRKYLVKNGKSYQNPALINRCLDTLEKWLQFHPKANDRQVANFMKIHQGEVYAIMPGRACKNFEKLNEELTQILNSYAKN